MASKKAVKRVRKAARSNSGLFGGAFRAMRDRGTRVDEFTDASQGRTRRTKGHK